MVKKAIIVNRLPNQLSSDIQRLFNRMANPWEELLPLSNGTWRPNTDIVETPKEYIIRMELAGVEKDAISITLQNNALIIFGERRDPIRADNERYLQLEINYHDFERIIPLPDDIETEDIEAMFENGMLFVEIPKQKPATRSKTVKVTIK
ncbi:MAG TPA: Hsp20/alpha crystallin family protein [bacterium]|nr:Hsp20/alpha crystallin family protein [bacterium]